MAFNIIAQKSCTSIDTFKKTNFRPFYFPTICLLVKVHIWSIYFVSKLIAVKIEHKSMDNYSPNNFR